MKDKFLTNSVGSPVSDDNNSISTKEGYGLVQDVFLTEKLAHFNRERIPERVVHAKGGGAHGYFEVIADISKYTKAKFLSNVGKKTEVFARFSTVGGELGSADTARDPRGFALKFYTEDGNYDLVGNNTPVFFVRDAIKFPDFIHTQKRNPKTHLKDHNAFWDFASLNPETLHQMTILFTDYGTPNGFRHMNGFSSHTYMWYNKEKDYVWVKYHIISDQGREDLPAKKAKELESSNPDFSIEDLKNAIEKGNYPSWTMYIQIMTKEEAQNYKFDPFDVTKVWYHADYPLIPIGKLVLNKNPQNYFSEVEQVAFAPSHIVPGIAPSPDKLLQGRLISYGDAHRYRLGANADQIPINQAKNATVINKQRDGNFFSHSENPDINYYPNSVDKIKTSNDFNFPDITTSGELKRHKREIKDIDFEQPRALYERVLKDDQKEALLNNLTDHMKVIRKNIAYRQVSLFYKMNSDLGSKLAKNLDLDLSKVEKLANLTQEERVKETQS